jgi:hypothetical protein
MSAPNPVIAPQTAATSAFFEAQPCDKVLFAVNGVALTGGDSITFSVANSTAGTTPVYDSTGAQVALTAALQSVMLEGGFLYVITKGVTAAASGVDACIKPRIGPH